MGTYEEERLIREISAVQLELRAANEQSRASGHQSERSFVAIRSDLGQMDDNFLGIRDSLQQIEYSLNSQLPLVVSQLARLGELLERIMNSVQNPVATRADEFRRHGLLAFKNGWASEAITEFRKSIDVYGYDPSVHFALGCVLAGEHDYPAAAESFAKAAKYGFPEHHSLAASAAILSAGLYDETGASERAADILAACHEAIPDAADVVYELARRTGKRQHLCAALALKPSLVVRARVDNLAGLEGAAGDVLDSSPGFAGLQADAARASDEFATLLEQEGQPSPERVVPLPAFSPASARLALFAGQLPLTRERLSSAISQVRAYAAELSGSARSSLQDAYNAQSRLAKPVPPPGPNVARNIAARPAIWGTAAFIMLILVVSFQTSHLANTASGRAFLTGLVVWVGFLASAAFFIASIRPALGKARENAAARSRYRTFTEDYRKRLAAYESESRKAAELRSVTNEASRKAEAFNTKADSAITAAEVGRRRLDWSVVEPIAMYAGAGTKSIGTD
jgi:tetratricopeptide (TPR) repeat protein